MVGMVGMAGIGWQVGCWGQVLAVGRTPGNTSEMPGWWQLHQGPTSAKPGGAETLTLSTPSLPPFQVPGEPKHHFTALGSPAPAPDWLRPQNPARSKVRGTLAPVFGVPGCG